jgi:hypothetical protein
LELFGGSPRPLMAHLMEMGKLTLDDIRALETDLDSAEINAEKKRTRKS